MAAKPALHILVPKHSIVKKEEVPELMKKLQVQPDKLPLIQKSDPAIKHLHPETGDIIKIERKSHTAGNSVYYRIVCP